MSDQEQNNKLAVTDPTKLVELLPKPEEVEKIMIQRELETQKALDGRAQMFALYMPRFRGQLNFMSKKELLALTSELCSSEYTDPKNITLAVTIGSRLNLNSIRRTIGNAIEAPLNDKEIKTFSKGEKKFFDILEALLSEKYDNAIISITTKDVKPDEMPRTIEEVVKHLPDKKKFDKRKQVEKDAFATGNQIMLTKTLMMHHTLLEYLNEQEKKNESLGSVKATDEENKAGTASDAGVTSSELSQSNGEVGKQEAKIDKG